MILRRSSMLLMIKLGITAHYTYEGKMESLNNYRYSSPITVPPKGKGPMNLCFPHIDVALILECNNRTDFSSHCVAQY